MTRPPATYGGKARPPDGSAGRRARRRRTCGRGLQTVLPFGVAPSVLADRENERKARSPGGNTGASHFQAAVADASAPALRRRARFWFAAPPGGGPPARPVFEHSPDFFPGPPPDV